MCTGVELMAIAAVSGAAMTGYGMYQQGQTQKDMSNYNAEVTRVKQADAISSGAIAEEKQRQNVRQIEGAQTAAMGASGGEVGSGSFGDILDQTAKLGELDALTVRSNALKSAWGLETQANADTLQGAIAANQGGVNAAASLLSAAPGIYKSGSSAGWWK